MTKLEFEELQRKFASSGMSLKPFLNEYGVATSSYYYWSKKFEAESRVLPMAPISFKSQAKSHDLPLMDATEMPGVTLAFPNGVRAHFGRGSESVIGAEQMYHPYHFQMYRLYQFEMYRMPF